MIASSIYRHKSIELGAQEEMPESDATAEPDTDASQSGGAISGSDDDSDSDVDNGSYEAAKAKRIALHLRQLQDYNMGPESANITAIYPSNLDYAYTIGHHLLYTPKTSRIHAKKPQGGHGVSSIFGVASIYGKGTCKHVETRRLRVGSCAKGAQVYWLSLTVSTSRGSAHKGFLK